MQVINKAVALESEDRYQTALEMRRDLERVMLQGNCTADEHGNILLINKGNLFRYEILPTGKNSANLIAYKRNIKSGRETRVPNYCQKGLSGKELKKAIQKFCLERV